MKKAIVTGGTGFVGSNLCRELLKKNFEVHVISKKKRGYSNIEDIKNRLKIFEYDGNIFSLIDYMKKVNADVVFHLSSLFIAEHETKDVDELIESNIKFGTQLLEAMKESKTELLINTGTSWQHYNSEEYNPVDLYAATKEAFEKIVTYYTKAENIRCITLKLFDTYGENDTRPKLINTLNQIAAEGKELIMSPGEQSLDLTHVEDVINAFICAYNLLDKEKSIKNKEFAVATGEKYKLKQVITIFEKITNKKLNINWGGKPYRKREVMDIWNRYSLLPGWSAKIKLEEGLKRRYAAK